MTRVEEVKAIMVAVRENLQQIIRESPVMQMHCLRAVELETRIVLCITVYAQNLAGEQIQLSEDERQTHSQYVPRAITEEVPDWMRGMKVSLESPNDTRPFLALQNGTEKTRTITDHDTDRSAFGEYVGRQQDPHYHVLVESLPSRVLIGVIRCATWADAAATARQVNASSTQIASIPVAICRGDCPKVDQ